MITLTWLLPNVLAVIAIYLSIKTSRQQRATDETSAKSALFTKYGIKITELIYLRAECLSTKQRLEALDSSPQTKQRHSKLLESVNEMLDIDPSDQLSDLGEILSTKTLGKNWQTELAKFTVALESNIILKTKWYKNTINTIEAVLDEIESLNTTSGSS